MSAGIPMTKDEVARAIDMRRDGASWGAIGSAMGFHGEAVRAGVFRRFPELRASLSRCGPRAGGGVAIALDSALRPDGVTARHFSAAWFRQNQASYAAAMRAGGYGGDAAARMRGSGASPDGRQI